MISFEPDQDASVATFIPDSDQGATPEFGADLETPPEPGIEELRQQSYQEGYTAARAELPWNEATQVQTLVAELVTAVGRVRTLEREYLDSNRELLVDLAVTIAEEIIGRSADEDRQDLLFRVERALSIAPEHESLRIQLGATDLEALRSFQSGELERLEGELEVQFEERSGLGNGDVLVTAGARHLDARVASQLREIRQALTAPIPEEEG